MKKKIVIIASVVMVALIGLAVAGGAHWHGPKSAEDRVDFIKSKITRKLDLDESQTAVLDRIAQDVLAEHDEMQIRRDAFRERFFDLMQQDNVTSEELTRLFEEKKPDMDRLMALAATHIAEFHSILTPQQRTTLVTELENHRQNCRFARWSTQSQEMEGK